MPIDLRSDTVTHPTPQMRKAMYEAEVGDDVYGEDPTINRLQELAAGIMGKEDALFVPSGTMGNAIAVLTHAGRGQAVLVGDQSHIYHYEAGGPSTLGGSPMVVIPNESNGMLNMAVLADSITDESDPHSAASGLVCIENTHNRCGGKVLSIEQIESMTSLAHGYGVPVHMDGARVFNAATALRRPVKEVVESVDSVMFCLSKGLSAPVGSMLVGSHEFIRRALRTRKLLGGGMRQAGVLAAAGIIALEQMVDRLADDHEHCHMLANGLADFPQVDVDAEHVMSNILFFSLRSEDGHKLSAERTAQFIARVKERGVLIDDSGHGNIRAVTHYGIEREDVEAALQAIKRVLIETEI
jgi:threonine aldolase